jgi:hypothetical protein
MMLLLIALLAATPLAWVVRHRGRRREHQEGKVDGALLLGALVCALIALVMSAVAATRSVKERRAYAASRPIETTVDACTVSAQRVGGRDAVRSHELRCELVFLRDSQPVRTTVWAGYPRHRAAYDEWVGQHPPGSTLLLRQSLGADRAIWGLERLVPATTTSSHAQRTALGFAVAGCLLLTLSRLAASRGSPTRSG